MLTSITDVTTVFNAAITSIKATLQTELDENRIIASEYAQALSVLMPAVMQISTSAVLKQEIIEKEILDIAKQDAVIDAQASEIFTLRSYELTQLANEKADISKQDEVIDKQAAEVFALRPGELTLLGNKKDLLIKEIAVLGQEELTLETTYLQEKAVVQSQGTLATSNAALIGAQAQAILDNKVVKGDIIDNEKSLLDAERVVSLAMQSFYEKESDKALADAAYVTQEKNDVTTFTNLKKNELNLDASLKNYQELLIERKIVSYDDSKKIEKAKALKDAVFGYAVGGVTPTGLVSTMYSAIDAIY